MFVNTTICIPLHPGNTKPDGVVRSKTRGLMSMSTAQPRRSASSNDARMDQGNTVGLDMLKEIPKPFFVKCFDHLKS